MICMLIECISQQLETEQGEPRRIDKMWRRDRNRGGIEKFCRKKKYAREKKSNAKQNNKQNRNWFNDLVRKDYSENI